MRNLTQDCMAPNNVFILFYFSLSISRTEYLFIQNWPTLPAYPTYGTSELSAKVSLFDDSVFASLTSITTFFLLFHSIRSYSPFSPFPSFSSSLVRSFLLPFSSILSSVIRPIASALLIMVVLHLFRKLAELRA